MEENIKLKAKIYDLTVEKEDMLEKYKTMNDALVMVMSIFNGGEVKDDISIQDVINMSEKYKETVDHIFYILDYEPKDFDVEKLPELVDVAINGAYYCDEEDCVDRDEEDCLDEPELTQLNDSPVNSTIKVYEDEEMSVDRAIKGVE